MCDGDCVRGHGGHGRGNRECVVATSGRNGGGGSASIARLLGRSRGGLDMLLGVAGPNGVTGVARVARKDLGCWRGPGETHGQDGDENWLYPRSLKQLQMDNENYITVITTYIVAGLGPDALGNTRHLKL